jgi:hypothetical protein
MFRLTIILGNAAMLTPEHVADALRRVAGELDRCGLPEEAGSIRDLNGNRVGTWRYNITRAQSSALTERSQGRGGHGKC